jgi:tRNA (guanine37-N1)-methyltransferase
MTEAGVPSGRTPYRVLVVTLFAEFFEGPLATSLLGKAVERGDVTVEFLDPRAFTTDRHRTVDDTPYGGGPGMVLKPEPLVAAIEAARERLWGAPVVMLTPQGERLRAPRVAALAAEPGLVLVCGRYEGFDERIRDFVDLELSIGDFVLSGGEPAALVVIDALSRRVEGVLGNAESTVSESFAESLLEYPQYTRPAVFRGRAVPEVLTSGNHARIEAWRREQALARTRARRPDLLQQLAERETGGEWLPGEQSDTGERQTSPTDDLDR